MVLRHAEAAADERAVSLEKPPFQLGRSRNADSSARRHVPPPLGAKKSQFASQPPSLELWPDTQGLAKLTRTTKPLPPTSDMSPAGHCPNSLYWPVGPYPHRS